jgi:Flp pilus assembly pilin Flp
MAQPNPGIRREKGLGTFVKNIAQHFCMNKPFWADQQKQDLTEYALILAFVVLAAAGIFMVSASSITTIWTVSNNIVTAAAQQAHGS